MVEEIQSYGMKPQYQYNYLLNQNKEKIVELLGKGFNFYPSNSWTYYWKQEDSTMKRVMFYSLKNE